MVHKGIKEGTGVGNHVNGRVRRGMVAGAEVCDNWRGHAQEHGSGQRVQKHATTDTMDRHRCKRAAMVAGSRQRVREQAKIGAVGGHRRKSAVADSRKQGVAHQPQGQTRRTRVRSRQLLTCRSWLLS
jgi:hypothetical protein